MARGTKLWQAAGSPIIQGRSRNERAYWRDVVPAVVLAAALGAVGDAVLSPPLVFTLGGLSDLTRGVLLAAAVAALPCLLVVAVGRVMGWPRVSVLAGILGGAIAVGVLATGWTPF